MNYIEILATGQITYRIDLAEQPTLQHLQRLLEELYRHSRLNPQYLFMNSDDCEAVKQKIIEGINIRCLPVRLQIEEHRQYAGYRLLNETTAALISLVPLPDLEQGTVIAGFFR